MKSTRDHKFIEDLGRVSRSEVLGAANVALLFLILSVLIAVPGLAAEPNLLLNGDFSAGATYPDHWTMPQFAPTGSFNWIHSPRAAPMLEIDSQGGLHHDYYWSQIVHLQQPGWYRVRAEIKTDPETRAMIEVLVAQMSATARQSDQDWTPLELYFKIARPGWVQVGCGLPAALAGRAFFRNLTLSRISDLPPPDSHQFDTTLLDHSSRWEDAAQLGVERAKPPPDESLLGDVVNFPVAGMVLLVLIALTFLDSRYGEPDLEARKRLFEDPQLRKSFGVATLLCLSLLGTWLVTRTEYLPGSGFFAVEPRAVGGDEPHYLIMINSLLNNHDLQLRAVYDDVEHGGPEAGVMSAGSELDRHIVVVNRDTGDRATSNGSGGWWHRSSLAEFAPWSNVSEEPAHRPAFPVLMALAVAPMRPRPLEVEPDVGFILMLIAWLGMVATYFVGRQIGMRREWAMTTALVLLCASPWLAYSRSYFAETTIGLALILGLWAFVSDLPILATLLVAIAATMKPPFALVGIGFFVEKVRQRRWEDAIKIAATLGLPTFALLTYNLWLHGSFLVLGLNLSFHPWTLLDTLVDPTEGLLPYAPWTIFGFLYGAAAFLWPTEESSVARAAVLPIVLYLIVLSFIGFGSGYSYGPRYWIAFLPFLALMTVDGMRRAGNYQRAVCAALVLFAVAVAIPGALRYPQLFQKPALYAWRDLR